MDGVNQGYENRDKTLFLKSSAKNLPAEMFLRSVSSLGDLGPRFIGSKH